MTVALQSIRDIVARSEKLQLRLKELNYSPDAQKRLLKRFSITETAKLSGRTPQAIRDAEKRGDLPSPKRDSRTGRRVGYQLSEINDMRALFGTRTIRNRVEDSTCILGFQNFKGGVGKSTIATHVAQYLARAGMRVLLIDLDSQGSTTHIFGYSPDLDLSEDDTLYPFFLGERRSPQYAIRDTYWDGLKLIPANLALYGAEYALAARMRGDSVRPIWFSLRDGIDKISDDFDVIILDPPPALGMISLNALYAANAVIVPMPPGMLDFSSTIQFFTMVEEVMGQIATHHAESETLRYDFIKILLSRKKQRTQDAGTPQDAVVGLARDFYASYMMQSILYDSAEIEAASVAGKTVYELDEATASHKTYKRALETLDTVGAEVARLIRMTWPSHRRVAEREGWL